MPAVDLSSLASSLSLVIIVALRSSLVAAGCLCVRRVGARATVCSNCVRSFFFVSYPCDTDFITMSTLDAVTITGRLGRRLLLLPLGDRTAAYNKRGWRFASVATVAGERMCTALKRIARHSRVTRHKVFVAGHGHEVRQSDDEGK